MARLWCWSSVQFSFDKVCYISFTLSTLTPIQRYSNSERQTLANMFGDHQPLKFIFNRNKRISITAATRIARWAITHSSYDYVIEYKKGSIVANFLI